MNHRFNISVSVWEAKVTQVGN